MRSKRLILITALVCFVVLSFGCGGESTNSSTSSTGTASNITRKEAGALPDNGFKAQISLIDPPEKLRAGQKETLRVKVKNASDAQWFARGGEINTYPDNRYYLAVGNRWLNASDQKLITNMDGRYGLSRDLQPGEELEVPLQITVPKDPGEYILDVDLVQEQVAWFSDKGSPTAKVRISVVR